MAQNGDYGPTVRDMITVIKQTPPRLGSSSKRTHNIPRLREFFPQKLQKNAQKWPQMVIMAQRFEI